MSTEFGSKTFKIQAFDYMWIYAITADCLKTLQDHLSTENQIKLNGRFFCTGIFL